MKKITVLYNEVEKLPFADDKAIMVEDGAKEDAQTIAKALKTSGYKADTLELSMKTIGQLGKKNADLYFNLCDGIGSLPKTEHKVPEILDRKKLPYTGADASSLLLTTNKALTKRVFEQNGIPTPAYALFEAPPASLPKNLYYPLIVKPMAEDCSLGIDTNSVVENLTQLRRVVHKIVSQYHEPALVEEYIRGRELNITVMGNGKNVTVLPVSEIIFGDSYKYDAKPKVVDFKAKWVENSANFRETVGVCPAKLSAKLRQKIERLAIQAYLVCGARDYARIDIRLSRDHTPYFLEVNANPCLSPDMGASRSAKAMGLDYSQFISEIASLAVDRYEHHRSV
ncbi:MAG: ATP-grasp domain-containing protein [Patescibacteria group bacterium]|nr:ATP-grasp domain-containing protein [Patescibacteria group bacterium]MCL5431515.1 ATP-grasp domain-containing protein [Patescibacteria group bacterium]